MGLEDLVKRGAAAAGVQVPGVPGVPGGLPKLPGVPDFGGMFKKGAEAGAGFVADKATAAARAVAIGQLPDKLDLAKSPQLETFVEKGLVLLGAQGIKVDGKPDPKTLEGLNTVLASQGRPALASLSDFTKDDLKAFNTVLGDSVGADGKPNQAAHNHLATANQTFVAIQKDYPKPATERAPTVDPSMSPGG